MSPILIGALLLVGGWYLHDHAKRLLEEAGVDFGMVAPVPKYLTGGVFRLRHPAYIGCLMEVAGLGMIFLGWGGAILAFAAWPFYADRIYREERFREADRIIAGYRDQSDRATAQSGGADRAVRGVRDSAALRSAHLRHGTRPGREGHRDQAQA